MLLASTSITSSSHRLRHAAASTACVGIAMPSAQPLWLEVKYGV